MRRPCSYLYPRFQVITFALISMMNLNCGMQSKEISSRAFEVFEDFTFVGTSADEAGAPVGSGQTAAIPVHGTARLPLPQAQSIGALYVFHHRHPVDNEKLALVELPLRLRMIGIRLVDWPKSNKDLTYPFVGGPLFQIRIADGDHEGRIYNQLDPTLVKASEQEQSWSVDDYILVWLK